MISFFPMVRSYEGNNYVADKNAYGEIFGLESKAIHPEAVNGHTAALEAVRMEVQNILTADAESDLEPQEVVN